jgi:hypothetical protein
MGRLHVNEFAYESSYDLLQIVWPYDFVYDTKIERLDVRYDSAYEFVYEFVYKSAYKSGDNLTDDFMNLYFAKFT